MWTKASLGGLIAIMTCCSLTGIARADDLDNHLREVDNLRAGPRDTPFDEVKKLCEALLGVYKTPADQAKIYFTWAEVHGQSGVPDPTLSIELAKKALDLPLDPEKRLRAYMYWASALQMRSFGVDGEQLPVMRPKVAEIYLTAINECAEVIRATESIPLPPAVPPATKGAGIFDNKAFNARRLAKHDKNDKLERLQISQKAFYQEIAGLYGRPPFATAEIEALAFQSLKDPTARNKLMKAVEAEVAQTKMRIEARQGKKTAG